MGCPVWYRCRDCGCETMIWRGPAFVGTIILCDRCGAGRRSMVIGECSERVGEVLYKHRKPEDWFSSRPLDAAGQAAMAEIGRENQERLDAELGLCECGGHFSPGAPNRCRQCRSTNLTFVRFDECIYE